METAVVAGGLEFTRESLDRIRSEVREQPEISRSELARRVCRWAGWASANGKWRVMSCRLALRCLADRGEIELPAPNTCRDQASTKRSIPSGAKTRSRSKGPLLKGTGPPQPLRSAHRRGGYGCAGRAGPSEEAPRGRWYSPALRALLGRRLEAHRNACQGQGSHRARGPARGDHRVAQDRSLKRGATALEDIRELGGANATSMISQRLCADSATIV